MAMLPNPLPALADDPTGASLGLRLPPGRLVADTDDGPWHEPLLWIADEAADSGVWGALLPARAAGLHPVLLDLERFSLAQWQLSPATMSYPGDHDAEEVLVGYWTGAAWQDADEDGEDGEGEAADRGDSADEDDADEDDDAWDDEEGHAGPWPGLAPAGTPEADPDERAAEVARGLAATVLGEAHAALVRARRSADVPAAIGWTGPANFENDVARLCTVLRSWEDRFGIRVVALGFDTLTVSVAAPPRTAEEAEAVAAEHYAFCPDNVDQGCGSLEEYAAKEVLGRTHWSFWWD
jgi:hypothetical protein